MEGFSECTSKCGFVELGQAVGARVCELSEAQKYYSFLFRKSSCSLEAFLHGQGHESVYAFCHALTDPARMQIDLILLRSYNEGKRSIEEVSAGFISVHTVW